MRPPRRAKALSRESVGAVLRCEFKFKRALFAVDSDGQGFRCLMRRITALLGRNSTKGKIASLSGDRLKYTNGGDKNDKGNSRS